MANDRELYRLLNRLGKKLPRFPDGRINYKTSNLAPVITVVVKYKDHILIMKRSRKVGNYKGKWYIIGGYIDKPIPPKEQAYAEIREETGIKKDMIKKMIAKGKITVSDKKINKAWIVYAFLAELKSKPRIKIDFEHTEYKWIKPSELGQFNRMPVLRRQISKALS